MGEAQLRQGVGSTYMGTVWGGEDYGAIQESRGMGKALELDSVWNSRSLELKKGGTCVTSHL